MQSVEHVWGSELDDQLLYCPGSSNQGTPASHSEVFIGSAGSASIAPRFTFNSTGSAVCMWSSRRLRCYLGGFTVDFSTFFDWSPVSNLPSVAFPLDDCQPTNWRIVDTLLLSFPCSASGSTAGKGATQGLAVLLTSKTVSRSLLCYLPDLRTPSRGRTISLHGKAVMLGLVWPDDNQSTVPLSGSLGVFSETMFAGVLTIAFEHGLVALIDLCLDWPVSKVGLNFRAEPAVASALAQSRKLLADDKRVSPFSLALEHTLMHLNDAAVSWDRFYYQLPNEKVAIKIPSQSVTVTLLQIIRPIKSLIIGFSFGGWQIWRLTDLKLTYTFQNPSLHCAVVSCAFAEPSDDPRYCCYLWVGWQAQKRSSRRRREPKEETTSPAPTAPTCTLFQLGFRNRTEHTNSLTQDIFYEYDNFFGASPRLSTKLAELSSLPNETPFVSQLKAVQSLSSSFTANRGLHSSRLTAIIWRPTAHIVRIGLFDIDRWYHAQMPSSIWPDNSFFAVYDAALDSSKSFPLTAHILPQSLLAFWVRTLRLERASAGLCGTTRTKKRPNVSNGVPLLRKPLPEVQMRPSVHAFEALVPFVFSGSCHQRPDDHCPQLTGNFLSLKFVSRQEKCLRDLSKVCLYEKQPSQPRQAPSPAFNVYLWITEAVACGLIRELEDVLIDDVSRIFDDSDPLMGIRLSLGLDNVTPEMLQQLGLDPNERFSEEPAQDVSSPRQSSQKRRRLVSEYGQTEVTSGDGQTLAEVLRPQWVVVANTLFEQKMLRELMGLTKLKNSSTFGATNTTSDSSFIRAWIWLRWLGYKTTFNRLCEPIFLTLAAGEEAEGTDSQKLNSSALDEINACVSQLRELADLALNVLGPAEKQDDVACDTDRVRLSDQLRIIRAYSDYTHTVGLLLRLGLLPQVFSEDAVKAPVFGKFGCVRQLTPYCPVPLARLIASFQKRYADLPEDIQSRETPFSPPITYRLLKYLFGQTEREGKEKVDGTSIAKNIWMDQEDLVDGSGSSQLLFYPPRRLQSVCALWQAWDAPARARTALLIFLLFDWVAVLALLPASSDQSSDSNKVPDARTQRRVRYRSQSPEETSPTARAIKMHKYVVTEFLKDFPTEKPLLTAIQTLWLFDRCRFKEILTSDLSPIVTGQVTSLSQLPEIFPNQAHFLVRLSLFFGQTRLALLFDPAHTTDDPALYTNFLPANPKAVAAPLAALTRLRRMYASVPEEEAAALFLQCVRYFLKYGRLLDLLNSNLSSWETTIFTDYLKSSGYRDLLFCCLLARSQYKVPLTSLQPQTSSVNLIRINPPPFVGGNQVPLLLPVAMAIRPAWSS
uniref:ELYS beta-propeller domain-containing protein n=1 Tax=Schistocephalus solidus TaxID=70667 RepID=A0A0X3NSE9_SCHSO